MNAIGYGLKEMNEMDYGLKEVKWNMISEVDNVTRVEARLGDNVMMWYKPITEHYGLKKCPWKQKRKFWKLTCSLLKKKFYESFETFPFENNKCGKRIIKPLPSDNFNINKKNVILSKYILVFDIQIKTRCVKWLK